MHKAVGKWLLLRPGEGVKTTYFLLFNVLLGIGMAIGRASSEALFFNRVGVDQLPRFYILLSIVLLLASMIYAAFVDRLSAERLMRGLTLSLLLLLCTLGALIHLFDTTATYYGYFLLYELVSEILIVHMAHYLAQNLDLGQGKRLMPTILAGNQIGIIVGGLIVATLSTRLPTLAFVYLWATTVLLSLGLLHWWHQRMGRSPYFYPKPQRRASLRRSAQEISQGARALWTIPLARAGAMSLFLMVITFYLLNFAVNKVYVARYPDEQSLIAFFGWLNAGLSLAAIVIQVVLSGRAIQWLGIKQVSLLYPLSNMLSFGALLLSFSLLPALLGSITRGVVMQAFHFPSNNLIYSIMSLRMQGRVRAAMLGLVMPLALVLCGVALDWLVRHYPFELILWLGGVISLLYFISSAWLSNCYYRELVTSLKDKIFLRSIATQGGKPDSDTLALMESQIDPADDESTLFFIEMLSRHEPVAAAHKIATMLPHCSTSLRDRLLNTAIDHQLKLDSELLMQMVASGDEHLQATILRLLSLSDDVLADPLATQSLAHRNPRLRAAAIRHLVRSPDQMARVVSVWQEMFQASSHAEELALASLAEMMSQFSPAHPLVAAYQQLFVRLLASEEERLVARGLEALACWPFPIARELVPLLERHLQGEALHLRKLAYQCLALLPPEYAAATAWHGLEDIHLPIREASLAFLQRHHALGHDAIVQRLGSGKLGHPRQVMTLLGCLENKNMPRHAYETIAEGLLNAAHHFAAAGAWTAAQKTRHSRTEILLHTLRERFHQMVDAALAALQGCENREELRIVRAILASSDIGSRTRASEVISHIRNRELARQLMETIEHTDSFNYCMQRYRHLFSCRDEAERWCRKRDDRWLAELVTE